MRSSQVFLSFNCPGNSCCTASLDTKGCTAVVPIMGCRQTEGMPGKFPGNCSGLWQRCRDRFVEWADLSFKRRFSAFFPNCLSFFSQLLIHHKWYRGPRAPTCHNAQSPRNSAQHNATHNKDYIARACGAELPIYL